MISCLFIGTIGFTIDTHETKAIKVIIYRHAVTIAVCFEKITVVIFTLILNSKVKTFNHTEEIGVTVGRNAIGTLSHKVVRGSPGITTPFNQHIGVRRAVISYAIVSAIIE